MTVAAKAGLALAALLLACATCASAAPPIACTAEAKLCPDGSGVGRTGPNCEFAPCPGGPAAKPTGPSCNMAPVTCPDGTRVLCKPCPASNSTQGNGAPGSPPQKTTYDPGITEYPDLPLPVLVGTQSAMFIVQHRTALNDHQVIVRAIVTKTFLSDKACPSMSKCEQPWIVLSDTPDPNRDLNYDILTVLPKTDGTDYHIGQTVEINGIVTGNGSTVLIRKVGE